MRPIDWRNAIRDSDLDRTAKLVCFVISTYMNGKGEAYPAKETIASGAGLGKGKRSVDQAVNRIEAAGYLGVERFKGRRSFRYLATTPNVAPAATFNLAADAPLKGANVASGDVERRTNECPTSHGPASNVARPAPEVGFKAKTEAEAEAESAARPGEGLEVCDECGQRGEVAEWPDGRFLCEPCGRARFESETSLSLAKDLPA